MKIQNPNSNIKNFSLTVITRATAGMLLAATIPAQAQRYDDSVKSREYRGSTSFDMKRDAKDAFSQDKLQTIPVLKNVVLMSSAAPHTGNPISFGPYRNNSEHQLTISLTNIGAPGDNMISATVNDVTVFNVAVNIAAATFVVPPRSDYKFTVQNVHSISVSALVSGVITELLPINVGLPSAEEFQNPWLASGYLGCDMKFDRSPVIIYHYRTTGLRDKSTANWRGLYGPGGGPQPPNVWAGSCELIPASPPNDPPIYDPPG